MTDAPRWKLTAEQWARFMDHINNPPPPTQALIDLMAKHGPKPPRRRAMTLRQKIIAEIEEMGTDTTIPQTKALADAILAVIREHVTTEEALDGAEEAYWSDGDLVADVGDVLKKAILAALGEE